VIPIHNIYFRAIGAKVSGPVGALFTGTFGIHGGHFIGIIRKVLFDKFGVKA